MIWLFQISSPVTVTSPKAQSPLHGDGGVSCKRMEISTEARRPRHNLRSSVECECNGVEIPHRIPPIILGWSLTTLLMPCKCPFRLLRVECKSLYASELWLGGNRRFYCNLVFYLKTKIELWNNGNEMWVGFGPRWKLVIKFNKINTLRRTTCCPDWSLKFTLVLFCFGFFFNY